MPLKRAFLHIMEHNYAPKREAIRYPERLDEPVERKNITVSADREAEYRAGLRPVAKRAKSGPVAVVLAEPLHP
jgi:hypothetical protein